MLTFRHFIKKPNKLLVEGLTQQLPIGLYLVVIAILLQNHMFMSGKFIPV